MTFLLLLVKVLMPVNKMLGWKLDIGKVVVKEVGFDERKSKAAEALTSVGIEFEVADSLLHLVW